MPFGLIAIPTPQAVMLLESSADNLFKNDLIQKLRGVDFYSAITVMAGYPNSSQALPEWKAITFENNEQLGWIGLDIRKLPGIDFFDGL